MGYVSQRLDESPPETLVSILAPRERGSADIHCSFQDILISDRASISTDMRHFHIHGSTRPSPNTQARIESRNLVRLIQTEEIIKSQEEQIHYVMLLATAWLCYLSRIGIAIPNSP